VIEQSLLHNVSRQRRINWRFPNEYGLCERNLDCRQLAAMEVAIWKGESSLIAMFLEPLNCQHEPLSLRKQVSSMRRGWQLEVCRSIDSLDIQRHICDLVDKEGYCLLYYKAFNMKFLSYYQRYDITHWSLVTGYDEQNVFIADTAGTAPFFNGTLGTIPWTSFIDSWAEASEDNGAAVLCNSDESLTWQQEFEQIYYNSLKEMNEMQGLEHLKRFVEDVEEVGSDLIIKNLDRLEFDIHFYRRAKELWNLATLRGVIPVQYMHKEWASELKEVCQSWSLVMGVLMKWKRQKDRDYKVKLVEYLRNAYLAERSLLTELAGAVVG